MAGAFVTLSFVGAASIGLLVLPVAVLTTGFVARKTRARAEPLGAFVGAASICFFVAWVQRAPGGFDSRPWLVAGIVLAGAGVVGYGLLARRFAPPG